MQCACMTTTDSRIRVTDATYGFNGCKDRGSIQTATLRRACNGKTSCPYKVDHRAIGDPARGCKKHYNYQWTCGIYTYSKAVGAEASGRTATLTCPSSTQQTHQCAPEKLSRLSAYYRCPNGRTSDHSSYFSSACNGQFACNFRADRMRIEKATRKAACSSKLTFHYTYYCGSKKFTGSAYDADGDHYNMPWIKISCGDYVHHAGLGNTVLRSSMN